MAKGNKWPKSPLSLDELVLLEKILRHHAGSVRSTDEISPAELVVPAYEIEDFDEAPLMLSPVNAAIFAAFLRRLLDNPQIVRVIKKDLGTSKQDTAKKEFDIGCYLRIFERLHPDVKQYLLADEVARRWSEWLGKSVSGNSVVIYASRHKEEIDRFISDTLERVTNKVGESELLEFALFCSLPRPLYKNVLFSYKGS